MQNKATTSQTSKTDDPPLLYHYTSSNGLKGIIKGDIWITKIHYMNDSSELNLAFKYIREEIELQKSSPYNRKRSIGDLNEMLRALESIEKINVAVASFTENIDDLNQWRGYCKMGDGYCIGFEYEKLKKHIDKHPNYKLVRCLYKEDEHRNLIKELVNSKDSYNLPQNPSPEDIFAQAENFRKETLSIAPRIKANGFKDEKEWRLISAPLHYTDAEFRSGSFTLIPYWEFKLDLENTLNLIMIGPTPEKDLSHNSVMGLVYKSFPSDFVKINIKHSKIPFRNI